MTTTKQVHIRDAALAAKLDAWAVRTDRSVSRAIETIIRDFFDDQEWSDEQ